jgi:hypothetical protein
MKRISLILAGLSGIVAVFAGCGGSGGGSPAVQQKTATIVFSTVSSAHSAPLEGIQVTKLTLPVGTTVSNISTALVGRNNTGQIVLPTYNAPVLSFVVLPSSIINGKFVPIKFGPFAELTCTVAAGTTLNQGSFTIAPGDLQMTGEDSSGATISLQIPVSLSVSFGY